MPAKPKIKVVTEEIKEPETKIATEVEKPEVTVKEDEPATTQETDLGSAKLTSFSTLDVTDDQSSITKSEEVPNVPSEAEKEASQTTEVTDSPPQMSSDDVKNWLNDVRPDTTKEMEKGSRSGFKVILIIVLLLIAVGLAAGGFYYYKNNSTAPSAEEKQTPETQSSPTLTPSPEPTKTTEDLKKYSLNVLNGSGVSGEAKKVSDMLVENGFKEAKTGNASKTDYTKTEVALKKDVPEAVFTAIKTALDKSYDVVKSEKALDDKSTYDIVITVGTKKSS